MRYLDANCSTFYLIYLYKLFSRYLLNVMNSRWVKLSGTELLPGDVVSIGRSSGQNGEDKTVPADMLLLAGSAIVNEAILTGESTPQWKVILFYLFFFLLFCSLQVFGYVLHDGFDFCKLVLLCLCCFSLSNYFLSSDPIGFCLHYQFIRIATCWMFETFFIKRY